MRVFVNHIGFDGTDYKTAVLELEQEAAEITAWLEADNVERHHGERYHVAVSGPERIPDWSEGCYYVLDFSDVRREGTYRLAGYADGKAFRSEIITVTGDFLSLRMVNASRAYLKGERSSGEWMKADRNVPFAGAREGTMDLHGGWYDATGDFGIHLTQLSHTAVYNPMQSLLPSYVCFDIADRMEKEELRDCRILKKELLDEAYWGADYAMRLHREGGGFIRSVDRGEAFSEEQRRSVDYEYFRFSGHEEDESYLAETIEEKHYETCMRSGAGLAAAVLASAARHNGASGEYPCGRYLQAAEESFQYMTEHNEQYSSDGTWNFLDRYCALAAAAELYEATCSEKYLEECRRFFRGMKDSAVSMEQGVWFTAREGELYFHPSDEGFPLIAMMKYGSLEPDEMRRKEAMDLVAQAFVHVLSISGKPFGYAAFTQKMGETETRRYFFPNDTKAAPWWQGENARIASLAAAALRFSWQKEAGEMSGALRKFAGHQLDWIMGCNPFDSCMIDGFGRNNIQYFFRNQYDFMNSPGGICNGITSREADDKGLEFIMAPTAECDDNWRWAEQWLPHACWYLNAMGWKLKRVK